MGNWASRESSAGRALTVKAIDVSALGRNAVDVLSWFIRDLGRHPKDFGSWYWVQIGFRAVPSQQPASAAALTAAALTAAATTTVIVTFIVFIILNNE